MEVNNAQTFGDSWALGQVLNSSLPLIPLSVIYRPLTLFHFLSAPCQSCNLCALRSLESTVIFKSNQTLNHLLCLCVLQCESDYVVERPCEGDLGRQPYAKRECALLYSDVFAPCHNVVSVTQMTHTHTQTITQSECSRREVILLATVESGSVRGYGNDS